MQKRTDGHPKGIAPDTLPGKISFKATTAGSIINPPVTAQSALPGKVCLPTNEKCLKQRSCEITCRYKQTE